ncbi:MAG: sigma-70 family RNA polymerase sigma factor [Actinomycetota bacterium]|nr:sigma-70 family RNA polymerase sigma factor [Actinomycetota bacterium]
MSPKRFADRGRSAGPGEDRILETARSGDADAWAAIYSELAPALLAFLRARGAPEAEDLLGEVMVQVARDLPGFKGGYDDLRGWVFRIARNRLIDDARYRRRRPVVPSSPESIAAAAGSGDAEQDALDRIADERVLRLIRELRPSQRDVLILRLFSDLTIEETARALGKRPGAVKALQRRGLARLQAQLEVDADPSA